MICTFRLPPSSLGTNYSSLGPIDALIGVMEGSLGIPLNNGLPLFLSFSLDFPSQNSSSFNPLSTFQARFSLSNGDSRPSSLGPLAFIQIPLNLDSTSAETVNICANICAFSLCAREYKVSISDDVPRSEVIRTSYSNLTSRDDLNHQHSSSYTFDTEPVNDENTGSFEMGFQKYLADVLTGNITQHEDGVI